MFARMKKKLKDRGSRTSLSSECLDDNGNDLYRNRYSSKSSSSVNEQFNPLDYVSKIEELSAFDACVETADALAAASQYTSSSAIDKETGLRDCSVLVSPDGELLLLPQEQSFIPNSPSQNSIDNNMNEYKTEENNSQDGNNIPKDLSSPSLSEETSATLQRDKALAMMALNGTADVESSVFMGNDLIEGGDRAMNGFSATGWAPSATSLAIRQAEDTLRSMAAFVESLVLIRKDSAARVSQACDQLPLSGMPFSSSSQTPAPSRASRSIFTRNSGSSHSSFESNGYDSNTGSRQNTSFDVTTEEFGRPLIGSPENGDLVKSRVGPLLFHGGTLFAAMAALEQYHSEMAQKDASRWRKASFSDYTSNTGNDTISNIGVLNGLRRAASNAGKRGYNRERALREMQRRLDKCEKHLKFCKDESERRWNAVHQAEEAVTRILEEQNLERSRQREKIRMEQMQQNFTEDQDRPDLGVTDSEIWDLVSSVTESMENGSFEPTGLPDAPLRTPIDKSFPVGSQNGTPTAEDRSANLANSNAGQKESEAIPIASRIEIEHQCRLPELRAAALAADEAVEDTGGALLNVLSTLDTTRRSARVSAESCLLGVANAQAKSIRSLIALERESVEERMRNIEELERIADKIDVRADLDKYITTDKQQRSGSAWLGIDDDGGIASALAVLCSHIDGNTSGNVKSGRVATEGWDDDKGIIEEITPEKIEDAIDFIFSPTALDGKDEEDRRQAIEDYETSVDLLCRIAGDTSSKQGKTNRSTICYAMNQKRSSNTEIPSKVHFDGICRVFYSLLSGCDREASGLANGKMCMMLSQTFYMIKDDAKDGNDEVNRDSDKDKDGENGDRSNRIYVKNRLLDHPLWSDEEFWDQALYQCVAESLTHSGVFSQFELIRSNNKNSEWTEQKKMKWHDLKPKERAEAATQVQAVVFAQLGALAHSMIEFGCGIERASAFVRRMAIRNQLPISQRRMLLLHLLDRNRKTDSEEEEEEGKGL